MEVRRRPSLGRFTFCGTEGRRCLGDNPFTWLDVSKVAGAGWVAKHGIRDFVEDTDDWLLANEWALSVKDIRH